MTKEIGVGLMGAGTVGGGVARALIERRKCFARQVEAPLVVRRAAVRDLKKSRTAHRAPVHLSASRERKYWVPEGDIPVESMARVETRYYVRVTVSDRPGVLAQIAQLLGGHGVSIAAVNQKEANAGEQTAELVIMTHRAQKSAMQATLESIRQLPVVVRVNSFLRVEG